MTDLVQASRLGGAISSLAIRSRYRTAFAVIPLESWKACIRAPEIGRAIGYDVVDVELPTHPDATLAMVEDKVAAGILRGRGPSLVILDVKHLDERELHSRTIRAIADLVRETWSVDGGTALLLVSGPDASTPARMVGEALGQTDWAGSIAL